MKRGDRGRGRFGPALIASALLHGGVIAVLWVFASAGAEMAPVKVYAVNIVSPPPREAGEPAPERVVAEAEPEAEPQPEPAPPAPDPEPAPAPPTPAPRPAPQPAQPQRAATPPAQPAPRPAPADARRPDPAPAPAQPQRAATPPPAQPQRATTETRPPAATPARPAATQPAATPPAAQPPRQGEPAARPAPSTGPQPSPTSAGGENLAVRTDGAVCPSEAYCNNIAATVRRYFRRPPDSYSDRGDVCFRIARSGAVAELDVQRLRGSFAFRLALMEAVEQAGRRNEFGPLPREFGSDWLPVCVGVTPQM